ncbi:hypothetical protein JVW19_26185, partial [Vibrio cholerae O1]|nr:hypothetical protein [Vibrio cholerae O1]
HSGCLEKAILQRAYQLRLNIYPVDVMEQIITEGGSQKGNVHGGGCSRLLLPMVTLPGAVLS